MGKIKNAALFTETVEYMKDRTADVKAFLNALNTQLPCVEDEQILDVGCASGFITVEDLTKVFPAAKIVACDISESLISYAKENRIHKDVTFEVFDVGNSNGVPENWIKSFTKVVSFHCLHWVEDLPTAVGNIRSAVKDNGYFAANVAIAKIPYGNAVLMMQSNPKWERYIPGDIKSKYPMFFGWEKAKPYDYFKKTVQDAGFEIIYSSYNRLNLKLTEEVVTGVAESSYFQFTSSMDKKEKQEFYSDYIQAILSCGASRNESGELVHQVKSLWICAKAL